MKKSVIICAAGSGKRAGFDKNKLLIPLHGAPVLWHTVEKFKDFDEIIVTSSPTDRGEIEAICAPYGAITCEGGATRTQSVYNALKHVTGDIVLIHDGARPFVTQNIIDGCVKSVLERGSGICATSSTDTVILAEGEKITGVPERASVFSVQTPQGFLTKEIKTAYERAINDGNAYTDDSAIYRKYVGDTYIFEGDRTNVKLTFSEDFDRDERGILAGQFTKVGFGLDVHAFGEGDRVTLCGVKIPCNNGLIAHSDGDVCVHAVMDALLSGAGLKDIGHYFPDNDEKWLNADSMEMLKAVVCLLRERGLTPVNVSLSVQAEKPRLSKHIDEMKANLANVLDISVGQIAIAAGTCEGLGFVGKGRGIAAYCAVLLK